MSDAYHDGPGTRITAICRVDWSKQDSICTALHGDHYCLSKDGKGCMAPELRDVKV